MNKSRSLSWVVLSGVWMILPALNAEEATGKSDVKPPFPNEDFNEEQMRLAKIVHKRIVDYAAIKKKTDAGKEPSFTEYKETLNSGAQFDMAPIPEGSFTWKGEKEGDVLEVALSPFWIGAREVTWEEYDAFMYSPIARQKDGELPDFIREQAENDIDAISRPTPPYHPMTFGMARDGHPAVAMTQHAANKYCQWVSYQTGHFYRLPTEAEWEYACRAVAKGNYGWEGGAEVADQYAWFGGEAASEYQKPGLKKPNAWGLYDMHGNVLEWTLDQYVPNRKEFFGKAGVQDPWIRATKPYPLVTKGGHWKQKFEELAASARYPSDPVWKVADPQSPKSLWYFTDTPWLGMRLVRPREIPTAEEMYRYWNSGVEADE